MKLSKTSNSTQKKLKEVAHKPFSLAELARQKAAEGCEIARTLMRAAERAVIAGANAFRNAAYLPIASDIPLAVMKNGHLPNQFTLQINLLEWFSENQLRRNLPWAQPLIRLSVATEPKRSIFTITASKKRTRSTKGSVTIELQIPDGTLVNATLSADHFSQIAYCSCPSVSLEKISYLLRMQSQ